MAVPIEDFGTLQSQLVYDLACGAGVRSIARGAAPHTYQINSEWLEITHLDYFSCEETQHIIALIATSASLAEQL